MKVDQLFVMAWFAEAVGASKLMSEEQRADLASWEAKNLPLGSPTSSWPGWGPLIGAFPEMPERSRLSRVPRPHIAGSLRKAVFERDAYRCRRCSGWTDLEVDHIIPVSLGGSSGLANLQTLCHDCNVKKGVGA